MDISSIGQKNTNKNYTKTFSQQKKKTMESRTLFTIPSLANTFFRPLSKKSNRKNLVHSWLGYIQLWIF